MTELNLTYILSNASASMQSLFGNTTENKDADEMVRTHTILDDLNTAVPINEDDADNQQFPYYLKAIAMTFCVVVMCLGVVGNALVPIVILKTKDMRNSTNIFLMNLSIADLLVLLICTPSSLVEIRYGFQTWVLGREMCLAIPFVRLTMTNASVLTILALSFERFYAICRPLRAGYICTKTRAVIICALVWIFAALFASPILRVTTFEIQHRADGTDNPACVAHKSLWYYIFYILTMNAFYFIPLLILIVIYSIISKNLIEASAIMAKSTQNTNNSANVIKHRKQVIVMLGTVVMSFFVFLLPLKVLQLMITVFGAGSVLTTLGMDGFNIVLYTGKAMVYVHSAINPILYNLMSSKFRTGFAKLLKLNKFMKCVHAKENMQSQETLETTSTGYFSSKDHDC